MYFEHGIMKIRALLSILIVEGDLSSSLRGFQAYISIFHMVSILKEAEQPEYSHPVNQKYISAIKAEMKTFLQSYIFPFVGSDILLWGLGIEKKSDLPIDFFGEPCFYYLADQNLHLNIGLQYTKILNLLPKLYMEHTKSIAFTSSEPNPLHDPPETICKIKSKPKEAVNCINEIYFTAMVREALKKLSKISSSSEIDQKKEFCHLLSINLKDWKQDFENIQPLNSQKGPFCQDSSQQYKQLNLNDHEANEENVAPAELNNQNTFNELLIPFSMSNLQRLKEDAISGCFTSDTRILRKKKKLDQGTQKYDFSCQRSSSCSTNSNETLNEVALNAYKEFLDSFQYKDEYLVTYNSSMDESDGEFEPTEKPDAISLDLDEMDMDEMDQGLRILEKQYKVDPLFAQQDDETSQQSGDDSAGTSNITEDGTNINDPVWRKTAIKNLKTIKNKERKPLAFTSYIQMLLKQHQNIQKMASDKFINQFEQEMDSLKVRVAKKHDVFVKRHWEELPRAIKESLHACHVMISGEQNILNKYWIDMSLSSASTTDTKHSGHGFDGTTFDIDSIRGMSSNLANVLPLGGGTVIMTGTFGSSLKKELSKSIGFKSWNNKKAQSFMQLKEVPHFQLMTGRNQKSKVFLCLPNWESAGICQKNFVLTDKYRRMIFDCLIIPAITAMNRPNERIHIASTTRIAMERVRNEKGQLGTSQFDLSQSAVEELATKMNVIIAASDIELVQQAYDFFFIYQVDDIKQFARVEMTQNTLFNSEQINLPSIENLKDCSAQLVNTKDDKGDFIFIPSNDPSVQYNYKFKNNLFEQMNCLTDLIPQERYIYRLDIGYSLTFF